MSTKSTWWLTGMALALFLFIYFFERRLPGASDRSRPTPLLGISSNEIRALVLNFPSSTNTVRAERRDGKWRLVTPSYPAQQTAIDRFAAVLSDLRTLDRIAAHETMIQGAKSFGLDSARSVTIETETNRITLQVGNLTPLTNNVYVRLSENGEVLVTDGALLAALPNSPAAWRSESIIAMDDLTFDKVQIRSGSRLVELAFNPTNNLWQIVRPVVARADEDRIAALLHRLKITPVREFVSDRPLDLDRYGLQTPELEFGFVLGTNRIYTIEFGGAATNATNTVFARLVGSSNVVRVDQAIVAELKQPYKNFHDPALLTITPAQVDRVVVQAIDSFSVQKQPTGQWLYDPSGLLADPELIRRFVSTNLAGLEIVDIAKEVPTQEDLKTFGLVPPAATYAVAERMTNSAGAITNMAATEISFGAVRGGLIYARRSDETPVYMVAAAPHVIALPRTSLDLRDRQIWTFASSNVHSVTLSNAAGTNRLVRDAASGWVGDAIANEAIEETLFRLGQLRAEEWVYKGQQRLGVYGLQPPALQLSLALRDREEPRILDISFGKVTFGGNVYASVQFPGEQEPSVFEFPAVLFRQLSETLGIPR